MGLELWDVADDTPYVYAKHRDTHNDAIFQIRYDITRHRLLNSMYYYYTLTV